MKSRDSPMTATAPRLPLALAANIIEMGKCRSRGSRAKRTIALYARIMRLRDAPRPAPPTRMHTVAMRAAPLCIVAFRAIVAIVYLYAVYTLLSIMITYYVENSITTTSIYTEPSHLQIYMRDNRSIAVNCVDDIVRENATISIIASRIKSDYETKGARAMRLIPHCRIFTIDTYFSMSMYMYCPHTGHVDTLNNKPLGPMIASHLLNDVLLMPIVAFIEVTCMLLLNCLHGAFG